MTQHFSKSTVSASLYCAKCRKDTQHRIDHGRKGSCLECIARLEAAPKPAPAPQVEQGNLFNGDR